HLQPGDGLLHDPVPCLLLRQDVRIGCPADRHRRPVTRPVRHVFASPPSSSCSSTLITTVPLPARQKRVGSAGPTITAPGASACTVSTPTPPSSGPVCTCP